MSQSTLRSHIAIVAIILLLVGCLALLVDVPLAVWMADKPLHKEITRILNLAEIGGHGTGAAMILIAALGCSRLNWRRQVERRLAWRLIGGTFLGSLVVDLLKLLIPRVRPRVAQLENAGSVLDTFGRQLLEAGDHSRSALMSFPSGHAAVAAGLAASLCWFYPSTRPAVVGLAILASLQRISSSSHYLSDICFGAAFGLAGALLCIPRTARSAAAPASELGSAEE